MLEKASLGRSSCLSVVRLAALLFACSLLAGCMRAPGRDAASSLEVELNPPAAFEHQGKPFCFAGANNYYLTYKPRPMVDDVLQSARALGFPVMRIWGFIDIGSIDGSVKSVDPHSDSEGTKDGVYFQYWDSKQKRPLYNEGPDGLPRLDYALAKASELGLKLVVVLTNNWYDFGGMDQYLRWFGRTKHHEFYTAPEVRRAYKDYLAHLVNRRNTVNGKLYRDDPTIFSWELANEPRCKGTGPASSGWTNSTIVDWVDEMTSYIRTLDPNHLISVGDEGFLDGGGEHWAYRANDGVDHEAITAVPNVDFGTFHLYPEDWGASLEWGRRWIIDHVTVARRLGKPTVLEEYGIKIARNDQGVITEGLDERLHHYRIWNDAMLKQGGAASMVWILSGLDSGGGLYRDYDRYTTYRGDETAALLSDYARRFSDARACRVQEQAPSDNTSPYVRVRKKREQVATTSSGWAFSDG
jgi:mannan endo-1,4-beta-mannosidase